MHACRSTLEDPTVGSGAVSAGVFHLVAHAFFKACLFLGAGSIIHALHHEQDLRHMGGLRRKMPVTFRTMLVSALAMAGIPPLAGFFSKDEILWKAYERGGAGFFAWALGTVAAGCTAFYIFRLIAMAFFNGYRGAPTAHAGHDAHAASHAGTGSASHAHGIEAHAIHESPRAMTFPLVVLALGAAFIGFLAVPHVLGGHDRFGEYLEPVIAKQSGAPAAVHGTLATASHTVVEQALMLMAVMIAVVGIGVAHRFYVGRPALPAAMAARFPALHRRLVCLFGVDDFYARKIVEPIRNMAERTLLDRIDVRIIEAVVNGTGAAARRLGSVVSLVQDGSIQSYLTWMVLGTLILLLTLLS